MPPSGLTGISSRHLNAENLKLADLANRYSSTKGDELQSSGHATALDEILLLELREDGGRSYMNQSVRGLYKHVLTCITSSVHARDAVMVANMSSTNVEPPITIEEGAEIEPDDFPPIRPAPSESHRERIGSYLHPRDMRRLVTPFSATNEPEIIVRRHAVLLNFDPLRAILLRDRLLVLVPEGADSILVQLERRVRGGSAEVDNSIYDASTGGDDDKPGKSGIKQKIKGTFSRPAALKKEERVRFDYSELMDWEESRMRSLPFAIHCTDACLHTVAEILTDDSNEIQKVTFGCINKLLQQRTSVVDDPLTAIRHIKNSIQEMASRVQRYVSSLNRILDDDESMALMNLTRVIEEPEKYIKPSTFLEELADEPELILEAHLQTAYTLKNTLVLIQGQVDTASDLIDQKQDVTRNKLLTANMLISVFSLCIASGSFIGSLFGMNVVNSLESSSSAFDIIVGVTVAGTVLLATVILAALFWTGTLPRLNLWPA